MYAHACLIIQVVSSNVRKYIINQHLLEIIMSPSLFVCKKVLHQLVYVTRNPLKMLHRAYIKSLVTAFSICQCSQGRSPYYFTHAHICKQILDRCIILSSKLFHFLQGMYFFLIRLHAEEIKTENRLEDDALPTLKIRSFYLAKICWPP